MPEFRDVMFQVVANLELAGFGFECTSGTRSLAEQKVLWAQGRTKLYDDKGNRLPIITNALPGKSYHNFGLAMDFVRDIDLVKTGVQPSWVKDDFKPLADESRTQGLVPGYYWTGKLIDAPHVQYDLSKSGLKLSDLIKAVPSGNLQEIWGFIREQEQWQMKLKSRPQS